MNKYALYLFTFLFPLFLFSQNDQIPCANYFNQIEVLLSQADTSEALKLFSDIEAGGCVIRKGQYRYISRVSYQFGKVEESKLQMLKAVELGILGAYKFQAVERPMEQEIFEKYGETFYIHTKNISDSLLTQKLLTHGDLIYSLRGIYEADQALRRDSINKSCRKYVSGLRLNPEKYQMTQDHEQQLMCFNAFYQIDSIILQAFVDIVKEIGYVPGDGLLFGTVEIVPIILHTGHYQFEGLDTMYLKSVKKGTISPALYAAYKGYQEEWFKTKSLYLFTSYDQKSSSLTEEEIQQINNRRSTLGIPTLPATLWNTKLF